MDIERIPTMTLEEASRNYPMQWLGVKVIDRDRESGQPMSVKVIANSPDMVYVRSAIGMDDFCTFYTGPIPESNHVAML